MKTARRILCALLVLALAASFSAVTALAAERPDEVGEEAAAVIGQARLLFNQRKCLEARALLEEALSASGDPALEYALTRLNNRQWRITLQMLIQSKSVRSSTVFSYDETGRLEEQLSYNADAELTSVQVYEYGEDGFRCASVMRDADGNESGRSAIVCNEFGDPVRSEGDTVFEYGYDVFGDATLLVRAQTDGTEISRTEYGYDEYGSYTFMITTVDGISRAYPYDVVYKFGAGGKTMTVSYYGAGTDVLVTVREYEFVPFE